MSNNLNDLQLDVLENALKQISKYGYIHFGQLLTYLHGIGIDSDMLSGWYANDEYENDALKCIIKELKKLEDEIDNSKKDAEKAKRTIVFGGKQYILEKGESLTVLDQEGKFIFNVTNDDKFNEKIADSIIVIDKKSKSADDDGIININVVDNSFDNLRMAVSGEENEILELQINSLKKRISELMGDK